MPEIPTSDARLLAPAQVGELLGVSVDEVMALVLEGRLRGMRVGSPARWRVEESSVSTYLDDQAEEARRTALWRQAQNASFPELWGSGPVRHGD
ncbi:MULTISPECIES: helix-turn-helix domain-containing protein [Microbacterium]|uniref:helix-turn-helix domain-containing protein n=1 Tax=Microbacterium TaxID=33882 RepID=UPI00146C3480|nr:MULTISPECIES: helix-turn-helix domain-containing protein [Microbacterium]